MKRRTRGFSARCQTPGKTGDLVWIGNWGDGERSDEIREFLIEPVKALGLKARIYGVRYPPRALEQLAEAGIEYARMAAELSRAGSLRRDTSSRCTFRADPMWTR